jgi:PKD repeat protein
MKGNVIILGIIILLVCVGLSGCTNTNNPTDTEKNKFIGSWYDIMHSDKTLIFYSNNSVKWGDSGMGEFSIENGELHLNLDATPLVGESIWGYSFSDNDTNLTLTDKTLFPGGIKELRRLYLKGQNEEYDFDELNITNADPEKFVGNWTGYTISNGVEYPDHSVTFYSSGYVDFLPIFSHTLYEYSVEGDKLHIDYGDPTIGEDIYSYHFSTDYNTLLLTLTNPMGESDAGYKIYLNKQNDSSFTDQFVVSAEASVIRGIPPLTISFTGAVEDNTRNITSHHWNFGDGETSTQQNPSHTFQNSGTYDVIFTVTDDMESTGSDALTIQVDSIGIVDYSAFAESYDWVRIVGLVKNFGDDNIVKVKITATLYDSQGEVIGFGSVYTHRAGEYSGILLPQETTGFMSQFSNMPDYDHCTVEITSYSTTSQQAYHDNLKILDVHIDPQADGEFGYSYLSGIVRNLGSQDASSVSVYANLLDSKNNIVAVEETALGTVYSGQSETFNIWIWSSQDYDRYELEVTCWEYTL